MSNGTINGKQIINNTVVKTINGVTFSAQGLTAIGDPNVAISILSSGSTHSFDVSWIGYISSVSGGRNTKTTNSYLKGPGDEFMNVTPYILPFNATLVKISTSSSTNGTWIGEIHKSGVVATGATISISRTVSSWGTYSINFSEGFAFIPAKSH
jgi:hypothetical protein